jgi:hypothetical protein
MVEVKLSGLMKVGARPGAQGRLHVMDMAFVRLWVHLAVLVATCCAVVGLAIAAGGRRLVRKGRS